MMTNSRFERQVITVFLVGPSEVAKEKAAVEAVLREINAIWARFLRAELDLIRWENSTTPGIGSDAQAVINAQIADDYDLLVGLMWRTIGTATPRAASGTAEEVERAIARRRSSGTAPEIFFYFKRRSEDGDLEERDPEIEKFAAYLNNAGVLYSEFPDGGALERQARLHLSLFLQRQFQSGGLLTVLGDHVADAAERQVLESRQLEKASLLAREASANLTDATDSSKSLILHLQDFNQRMSDTTRRITAASRPGFRLPTGGPRGVVERFAVSMERFSLDLEESASMMMRSYRAAVSGLGRSVLNVVMVATVAEALRDRYRELRTSVAAARSQMEGMRTSAGGFRSVVASWPAASPQFAQCRDELIQKLGMFDRQLVDALAETEALEEALTAYS